MKVVQQIQIKNFKSFLEETFTVEDLTSIVGANESGKTNVLKAINEFSKGRLYTSFGRENGDFRLDSPDFPNGEIVLRIEVVLQKELIPSFIELESKLEGEVFWIEKRGKLNEKPVVGCGFAEKLTGIAGIIKVNNRTIFRNQMQEISRAQQEFVASNGWLFKDQNLVLTRNPSARLLKEGRIENLVDESRDNFLAEKILPEVTKNIRMLFWKYEEKDHYLPEKVLVSDFVANPSKYPGVDCMFAITGWSREDYANNLINYDSTTRDQLLRSTQDTVNELIRKHWSTHRELSVKLSYNGEHLDISLSEPGHETPPNFRSDGFKWFLAFLLFFKRHATSLNGHILLMDEPGGFLHPQGQKDVLKELTALAADNQVIYTTHQTFLINKNIPESVRVIKREKRGVGKNAYDSRVYNLQDTKHILTDRLLRESLGFLVSDISPLNESNILVEGEFDREVLIEVNKKFKIIDLNEVSFIACGRASNIQKHASLYIANELAVVGLYDSDEPAKSSMRAAHGFPFLHLADITGDTTVQTMEDMLPEEVFKEGGGEWKKKYGLKKSFNLDSPRMPQINNEINDKPNKVEIKHSLEDCLIEAVRKNIKTKAADFDKLKKVLLKLKEVLDTQAS